MLMLSFFRRGQNLFKGFRATDFDATTQQLPPYAVLNEELVQLCSEVLVHARVIVMVAEEIIELLNDVIHLEPRSEEHTSELQSQSNLVCRLLLEKKKKKL